MQIKLRVEAVVRLADNPLALEKVVRPAADRARAVGSGSRRGRFQLKRELCGVGFFQRARDHTYVHVDDRGGVIPVVAAILAVVAAVLVADGAIRFRAAARR